MSPLQRQMVREAILEDVHSAGRVGLPKATIEQGLNRVRRLSIGAEDLDRELSYLENKGLLVTAASAVSIGAVRWKITAPGTEYLEAEGII